MNKLYRSRTNTILGGVCAGLGEHLDVDPTLVRLIFVLLGVIGLALTRFLETKLTTWRAPADL